jgi:hypothetical protein
MESNFQNDRLGQIEYEEVLFDNISKVVVNRGYVYENQLFWDNLVFKFWEEYYFSMEEISIRKQSKLIEIFFKLSFEFKPSQELPEDLVNL